MPGQPHLNTSARCLEGLHRTAVPPPLGLTPAQYSHRSTTGARVGRDLLRPASVAPSTRPAAQARPPVTRLPLRVLGGSRSSLSGRHFAALMGHVIRERLPAWLLAVARLCGRRTVLGGVSPLLKRVRKDLAAAHPFLPPGSYLRPWATGRKPVRELCILPESMNWHAMLSPGGGASQFLTGLGTMWSASGAWTPAVYWDLGPLPSPEQEKDI
ncbi:uncharacterized protein LOC118924974 [Manis pentadactyla]|uniref:uncharacterized protein LOC118924974 n=1 Tax=Manis pentadactyla TaxID=143292 RepID=UPI00255CDA17|nr:uncharacterized protein LOC118924974 [Manis pentadactyla]